VTRDNQRRIAYCSGPSKDLLSRGKKEDEEKKKKKRSAMIENNLILNGADATHRRKAIKCDNELTEAHYQ
jgi:hypothetical protein